MHAVETFPPNHQPSTYEPMRTITSRMIAGLLSADGVRTDFDLDRQDRPLLTRGGIPQLPYFME